MAMKSENFEEAAGYIQRYRDFDESILEESSAQLLKTAQTKLEAVVKEKVDLAIQAEDPSEILR